LAAGIRSRSRQGAGAARALTLLVTGPESLKLPLYGSVQLLFTLVADFETNQRTLLIAFLELAIIFLIQITQPPVKIDVEQRLSGCALLRGHLTNPSGSAGELHISRHWVKTQ
jgi:hypothetical protein